MVKPHPIEHRIYSGNVQLQQQRKTPPKITGYAAVFNSFSVPLGGFKEIIKPGALDEVLQEDVRALFNHDPNFILGRRTAGTLTLSVDDKGLWYEITAPETETIHDLVLAPLQRGDINQSSFSFVVAPGAEHWYEEANGAVVREIHQMSALFDVGPVTSPAYEQTLSSLRACLDERQGDSHHPLMTARAQQHARERVLMLSEI